MNANTKSATTYARIAARAIMALAAVGLAAVLAMAGATATAQPAHATSAGQPHAAFTGNTTTYIGGDLSLTYTATDTRSFYRIYWSAPDMKEHLDEMEITETTTADGYPQTTLTIKNITAEMAEYYDDLEITCHFEVNNLLYTDLRSTLHVVDAEPIDPILVCGLDEPVAGAEPDTTLTSANENLYHIDKVTWYYDTSWSTMKAGATFKAGNRYRCVVHIVLDPKYALDEDTAFWLGQGEAVVGTRRLQEAYISRMFYVADPSADELTVTGLDYPVHGAADTTAATSNASYTVTSVQYIMNSKTIAATDVDYGDKVAIRVNMSCPSGYTMPESNKVYWNGEAADVRIGYTQGGTSCSYVWQNVTVAAPDEGIEIERQYLELDTPVPGESLPVPEMTSHYKSRSNLPIHATVSGYRYYDVAAKQWATSDIAEPGKVYKLYIWLEALPGYYLSDESAVIINETSAARATKQSGYCYTFTLTAVASYKANTVTTKSSTFSLAASASKQTFSLGASCTGGTLYYSSSSTYVTVDEDGTATVAANYTGCANITVSASGDGYEPVSKTVQVKVAPNGTSITSAYALSDTSLHVAWKKGTSSGAGAVTGYQVRWAKSKDMASAKTLTVSGASTCSAKITSLSKNTTYYIQVRTVKKSGEGTVYSAWSTAKSAKTGLKANTVSCKGVLLKYAKTQRSFALSPTSTGGKITYRSDTAAVTVNADGMVTVAAGWSGWATITVKASGLGYKEASTQVAIKVRPQAASIKKLSAVSASSFKVTWTTCAGATGYEIRYSTAKNMSKATVVTSGAKATAKTIKGCTSGKTYYVQIRTVNTTANGPVYSAWSAKKTVTPKK